MINKLKWKFARYMYGRYGVDQLYIASGALFIALQLAQFVFKSPLLNVASLLLMTWMFYRLFSKNIYKRRLENQKFLKWTRLIQSKLNKYVRRLKEIKTHRYRQCSSCKTTLRLPRKRGSHNVRCPKCSHLFEVKIWV